MEVKKIAANDTVQIGFFAASVIIIIEAISSLFLKSYGRSGMAATLSEIKDLKYAKNLNYWNQD